MKRIFGAKKDKEPKPTLEDAAARITTRGDTLDEKIRKLEVELLRHRDQIKRTRPGAAQEAAKARALRVLRQKKLLEGQRDNIYNQSYNMEQIAFAAETAKDAQTTMAAMKSANKGLKEQMKAVRIDDLDRLQDDMLDFLDYSNEIQETLGRSYGVPDDIDDDELMGELDALEADMGMEGEGAGAVPSYLADDTESDFSEADLNLPSAPITGAAPSVPSRIVQPTNPATQEVRPLRN